MNLFAARRQLRTLALAESEEEANTAAQALVELPGRRVQRRLERLLRSHDSPLVRARAAWTLGFHPQGAQALDALLETLADQEEDPDVRAHAAEALGHMADRLDERGEGDVLAALLRSLTDASAYVRFWSAFALGNLGDPRAIPALERLAERDTHSVPGWWSIRKEALDSIEQILLVKRNRDEAREREEA